MSILDSTLDELSKEELERLRCDLIEEYGDKLARSIMRVYSIAPGEDGKKFTLYQAIEQAALSYGRLIKKSSL